ncbi:hypothetical protein F5146DRAFT_1048341 [Armillaria mellea]|nr:hypothetical protein F5146DRAFT_1048341 [Armillaria mellea]
MSPRIVAFIVISISRWSSILSFTTFGFRLTLLPRGLSARFSSRTVGMGTAGSSTSGSDSDWSLCPESEEAVLDRDNRTARTASAPTTPARRRRRRKLEEDEDTDEASEL